MSDGGKEPAGSESDNRAGDLLLARAAIDGEERAVRQLVERLRCVPRTLVVLNRRMGGVLRPDDLEDATQDTLVAVWSKLGQFDGRARLETWVYRFCSFELLRRRRTILSRRDVGSDPVGTENEPTVEENDSHELLAEIHAGLDLLPRAECHPVSLKHFEGLTFHEIGGRLGIPANSAKTRYYRGLAKLRSRFAKSTGCAKGGPS